MISELYKPVKKKLKEPNEPQPEPEFVVKVAENPEPAEKPTGGDDEDSEGGKKVKGAGSSVGKRVKEWLEGLMNSVAEE